MRTSNLPRVGGVLFKSCAKVVPTVSNCQPGYFGGLNDHLKNHKNKGIFNIFGPEIGRLMDDFAVKLCALSVVPVFETPAVNMS
jgi:hypothetical protein